MEKGHINKTRYVYVTFDAKEIARFLEKRSKDLKNREQSNRDKPRENGLAMPKRARLSQS
jgi:hypothetical protein